MNIFVLDKEPCIAAKMLCDTHVIKMLLETAQLLCGVYHYFVEIKVIKNNVNIPYKKYNLNHPCAAWARESSSNFEWLLKYGYSIAKEYTYRYKKVHKSLEVIDWCKKNKILIKFEVIGLTEFVLVMPENFKSNDVVQSYRNYYMEVKGKFAKWQKGRKEPFWYKKKI